MTGRPPGPVRAAYGIDAPQLLALPALLIAYNLLAGVLTGQPWSLLGAGLVALCTALALHASRRGKFTVWARLLDAERLRGDERVLDLGCGRGAVLLLAAKRLPRGRAVGIDLWRRRDQSGNAAQLTRRNALAEGVGDRVELHTADMTALPFDRGNFDLVVSSLALHNVKGHAARETAIAEAVRVLRPGGRLLVADIRFTRPLQARLAALGLTNIRRRDLGWRMWWSGPWLPTRLVTATKPAS